MIQLKANDQNKLNSAQTQHALYAFTRSFKRYKDENCLELKSFSDGLIFAHIISSIDYFANIVEYLQQNPQRWTQKLANLKKIITKMQNYVETKTQKVLQINQIQLVQMAKNSSPNQILKFFEAVIAVLMQAPKKQNCIQRIMSLDERSQQVLMIVVQNAMHERISELSAQNKSKEPYEQLTALQNQNFILTQQINQLCRQNEFLLKQNHEVKQRIHECQLQIQKSKKLIMEICMNNSNKPSQIQKENSIIETFKKKMIQMVYIHQIQLIKLNDQICHYKDKVALSTNIQEELLQKNKLQEEKIKNFTLSFADERKKLQKTINEKQFKLKKLECDKIQQLSEAIEVNDLNLRMELQRKEVRLKQLQKQVKNKLNEASLERCSKKKIEQQTMGRIGEQNVQENEILKSEQQKLRDLNRELERDSLKLNKRCEKVQSLEEEKKNIISDISKCRDSEIQMLVASLYDLRNENIKMQETIKRLKWKQQSKYE